jgi:RHS repeat-associated protein
MRRIVTFVFLCVSLTTAVATAETRPTEVVPASAPRGARVIISGTGLDAANVGVTFTHVTGERIVAPLLAQTPSLLEVEVPAEAVSGTVRVTESVVIVGTFPFAVAPEGAFARVSTMPASLQQPRGAGVDARGVAYIADTRNHRIVAITPAGAVSVIAGHGTPGEVDGASSTAQFHAPEGVAFDATRGVLYVADTQNHVIRRIANGAVTTFAGSGKPADADGQGAAAAFRQPTSLAIDAEGNLFVADTLNHKIKRVTPDGVVATIAGNGRPSDGDGAAASAGFHEPRAIAISRGGALFVADTKNNTIRQIESGTVSTIAGTRQPGFADGPAAAAQFHHPTGVAVSDGGTLFVADTNNHRIRAVEFTAGGTVVRTIAGSGAAGRADGAPGAATFSSPSGLAYSGALYVADSGNDALRVLEPQLRLTALYPRRGPLAGNTIRLFGSGFMTGRTTVKVDARAAEVTALTPTSLVVQLPPGAAGVVSLSVTTPSGTAALPSSYVYLDPPSLTLVQPMKGTTAGGDAVTLRGTALVAGDTIVRIGAAPLRDAVVTDGLPVNDTTSIGTAISGSTPPGVHGPADVHVITPGGETVLPGGFSYYARPLLGSFTPVSGFPGTSVAIAGQYFDPESGGTIVRFGSVAANLTAATQTSLVAVVPQNAITAPLSITTAGGTVESATPFIVPVLTAIDVLPASISLSVRNEIQLSATGRYSDGSSRDVSASALWSTDAPAVAKVGATGTIAALSGGNATIRATVGAISGSATVTVASVDLPPDPAAIAPPVNLTVVTSLAESTAFLYTGTNPIQRDVAPNTIQSHRAAVLRGRAITRDGAPLSGVHVSILGASQFGWTRTRADGAFDLAVNGGGALTVLFAKDGYLPAQRTVTAGWNRFAIVEEVALIPLDSRVTAIEAGSATMQVARGNEVTDEDGARTATILFPAGTGASMTLPDGTTQTLPALHVRATEYTVGPNGPAAMPAPLPQHAAYTYCVELSADEAIAAGASRVQFTQPVIIYVDNFLGFPVGGPVPTGYFDRRKAVWVPSENGVVLSITGITAGMADLDLTGDGVPENAAELAARGVTGEERLRLAALYPAGKTLWRTPIDHFTPVDHNWAMLVDEDGNAADPDGGSGPGDGTGPTPADFDPDDTCQIGGSIIQCQSQVLGESLPVAGTPFRLEYRSSRVPGRRVARQLDITLTGAQAPRVRRIELSLRVAGKEFRQTFAPSARLATSFEWDGTDAYGRNVQGTQTVDVSITYAYPAVYGIPRDRFNSVPATLLPVRLRDDARVTRTYSAALRTFDARPLGLGGWMVDAHRTLDVAGNILYRGDGSKITGEAGPGTINTIAGTPCNPNLECRAANNMIATQAVFGGTNGVVVTPDGTILFTTGSAVARLNGGRFFYFAGSTNSDQAGRGDGGPATAAGLYTPHGLARASDGTIYVSERAVGRIRRIGPDGIITRFAGQGDFSPGFAGDGGPATEARFASPAALAVGPDGSLYVLDTNNVRIRRITADGIIATVAGDGTVRSTYADNVAATATNVRAGGIAVGPDGTLYISEFDSRIRAVGADGVIRTLIPPQCTPCNGGAITVGADGTLYQVTVGNRQMVLRRVSAGGVSTVVAAGFTGNPASSSPIDYVSYFGGDGGPATAAKYGPIRALALSPDGSLILTDSENWRLRRVVLPAGIRRGNELLFPEQDGRTIAVFDDQGKHLRTVDALTGATVLTFGYDSARVLSTITDAYGNVTSIQRSGGEVAIVAPGGQRTTLQLDDDGNLESLVNPAGETVSLTSTADGLLTAMKMPEGAEYSFSYGADGRLSLDEDPAGGSKQLTVTENGNTTTVVSTTAMNRATTYVDEALTGGDRKRTTTSAAGLAMTALTARTGVTTTTGSDGTVATTAVEGDPRFGMLLPFAKSWSLKTGTRTMTASATRAFTFTTSGDPLAVATATSTVTVNGRTHTSVYDAATRRVTTTSPAGRTVITTLNANGEVVSIQSGGLAPVAVTYDGFGRTRTISRGTSTMLTFSYDGKHRLQRADDATARAVTYGYDDADRLTSQTLPGNHVVSFGYDANGNLSSVAPPSRPAHAFGFNAVDVANRYEVDGAVTSYVHNPDRQLESMKRADGSEMSISYDAGGRVKTVFGGTSSVTYDYDTAGRLQSLTGNDGGAMTFTYDGGLLKSVASAGAVSATVTYTSDNDLRVVGESVGATNIAFAYDPDDLLTSAGALTLTRHPQHGLITATTLGNVKDSRTYNTLGEMTGYSATYNTTSLLSLTYGRDAAGRITSIGQKGFVYDEQGRLKRVTSAGTTISEYDYDPNGNRTAHRWLGGSVAATYDDQDRLLTYGDTIYTYTPDGDLRTKTVGSATTTFDYDGFGTLQRVTLPGGTAVEYVIDPAGRRTGRKVNGTLAQAWLYSGALSIVAELNASGAVVSRFVYGSRSHSPDYMIKGGVTYRIVTDHLGSPRLVVNTSTGAVAQRMEYDVFGAVTTDTAPGFQPFGFAGGLYDRDTGLVRFGARDYDPRTGRWTTKEPLGFAGGDTNFYAYVFNDPTNLIDPSGLDAVTADSHNLERMYELWASAGFGQKETERAGFLTENSGQYGCQAWPWSAAYRKEVWPKGKPLPRGVIAVVHTHPNKADPKPSTGDRASAAKVGLPFYTVTRSGIYKYDPTTRATTREEDSSWVQRAKQTHQSHQNSTPAQPACGCPQ